MSKIEDLENMGKTIKARPAEYLIACLKQREGEQCPLLEDDHIAWDYLSDLQKAQLAHCRPDIYLKIKEDDK